MRKTKTTPTTWLILFLLLPPVQLFAAEPTGHQNQTYESRDAFTVSPLASDKNTSAVAADQYTVVVDSLTITRNLLGEQGLINLSLEFATASASLTAIARHQVEEIAKALQNPELSEKRINICGHTDDRGSAATNLKLSQKRAAAVKNELVDLGIPAPRLQSEGHGESTPIADNQTAEGRARNRRVTLKLVQD